MNNSNQEPQPPLYPSIPPPLTAQESNPFLIQTPPNPTAEEINPFYQTPSPATSIPPKETGPCAQLEATPPHDHHQDIPSSSSQPTPSFDSEDLKAKAAAESEPEKWGTHVMGHPAVPTCHPDNKKAALWGVAAEGKEQAQSFHYPYLQYQPIDHNNNNNKSMLSVFNSWSHKAESMANNIWQNRMYLLHAIDHHIYIFIQLISSVDGCCIHALYCFVQLKLGHLFPEQRGPR